MALTASDFKTYVDFQDQAETYRYQLAQHMNKLQMENISNEKPGEKEKAASISHKHWAEQPDFQYNFRPVNWVVTNQLGTILSILLWFTGVVIMLAISSKWIKIL